MTPTPTRRRRVRKPDIHPFIVRMQAAGSIRQAPRPTWHDTPRPTWQEEAAIPSVGVILVALGAMACGLAWAFHRFV